MEFDEKHKTTEKEAAVCHMQTKYTFATYGNYIQEDVAGGGALVDGVIKLAGRDLLFQPEDDKIGCERWTYV